MSKFEKKDLIVIICFLTLITFPILYIFRSLDDNALTGWKWVFSGAGAERVFLLILSGIILSFFISKSSFSDRYPFHLLFILSFITVLPVWKEPEVILDASRYFIQAKHLELYGISYFFREWGKEIGAWTDMPAVPFLYGIIFRYLGESRIFIQLFNTLLFSSTVMLTCLLGRKLWDKETGFFSGLFLLGIPYLTIQVPLMLVDIHAMFFLTLSLFSFLKAIEKGGIIWIAFSVFAVILTLFAKYSVWLMLSVLPVTVIAYQFKDRRTAFYRAAIIMLIVVLISGTLLLLKYDTFMGQIYLLRTYQWSGLGRWQESFTSTFLFQTHPFISISAFTAIFVAAWKKDRRFLIAGCFAVLVFFLQIKRIRYILPLFPLFSLMASYGLNAIKDIEVKRFIGFCAVTSSVVIALFGFLPFLNKTSAVNLRDAGKYIDTLDCGEIVELYTLPQRSSTGNTEASIPILDLFTDKRIIYRRDKIFSLDNKNIEKSPLRFTWESKMPNFYSVNKESKAFLIAFISGEAIDNLPPWTIRNTQSPVLLKRFVASSGVFRYKTYVSLYGNGCMSGKEQ